MLQCKYEFGVFANTLVYTRIHQIRTYTATVTRDISVYVILY